MTNSSVESGTITLIKQEGRQVLLIADSGSVAKELQLLAGDARFELIVGALGDELAQGPIVCEDKMSIKTIIERIKIFHDEEVRVKADAAKQRFNEEIFFGCGLRLDIAIEPSVPTPLFTTPLHHQQNQHPTRPGKGVRKHNSGRSKRK